MPRGPDPQISDIEILRVFLSETDPAYVPSEIGDRLGVTAEGARHQMERLVDRGLLGKKKPGERTVLYWITPEGVDYFWEESGAN